MTSWEKNFHSQFVFSVYWSDEKAQGVRANVCIRVASKVTDKDTQTHIEL